MTNPGLTTDLPGNQLGRFRLLRHIATGGMAEIYLASMEGPGSFVRKCVVKRLLAAELKNPQAQAMFFTEARVQASLQHPNIVNLIDFGQAGEEYFLAMEYIDGASLFQLMSAARKKGIRLGIPIAVSVGLAISRALAYAHTARGPEGEPLHLVHRDVTPGNILITRSGHVKLADFGVVKVNNASHQTEVGMIKGKFAYMSPEQITAEPLDGRSDIFSLGVVLWELATRTRLFKRGDPAAELFAVAQADVQRPTLVDPTIPNDFERIVMRCLAKAKDDRYASASELCADLVEYRDNWELRSEEDELRDAMTSVFSDVEEDPVLKPHTGIESTSGGSHALRSIESFTSTTQSPPAHHHAAANSNNTKAILIAAGVCLAITFWVWLLILR